MSTLCYIYEGIMILPLVIKLTNDEILKSEFDSFMQEVCFGTQDCHHFTWYPSLGDLGICFLLKECHDLELCPYCISGPESGTDVDDCYDFTTTVPPTTTTQVVTKLGYLSPDEDFLYFCR